MSDRPPPGARAALLWAAALALLVVLTVLVLAVLPAPVAGGPPQRLWPPAEPAGEPFAGWTVERGGGRVEAVDGVLRLEAPRHDPYVLLRRPLALPAELRAVQVTAEARFSGTGGARPHEAARIHLLGRDAEGRLLPDRREDALHARATTDWTSVAVELAPPPGAATVELLVRLQRAAGRLELRRLELRPLVDPPWRGTARLALAVGWLGALAAGGAILLGAAPRRSWAVAALAATMGALLLILAPPELLQTILPRPLLDRLGRSESLPYLGHLGLALTVGLLAARAAGARRLALAAVLVPVAAAAGEAVQLLGVGREASPADALANAAGGLLGVALAVGIARLEGGGREPERPAEPRAEIERALPLVPLDAPQAPRG